MQNEADPHEALAVYPIPHELGAFHVIVTVVGTVEEYVVSDEGLSNDGEENEQEGGGGVDAIENARAKISIFVRGAVGQNKTQAGSVCEVKRK